MNITDKYVLFWGDDDVFSNFHPAPILLSGPNQIPDNMVGPIFVPTSEHAFMFFKACYFKDFKVANEILRVTQPFSAKKLGKKIAGFDADAWNKVSYKFMYEACFSKFTQNAQLRNMLLLTEGLCLVEASPYDKIWGIGLGEFDPLAEDEANWLGENRLGVVLNNLRTELLAKGFTAI